MAVVTHEVSALRCIVAHCRDMVKNAFLRLCCGTAFLGIPVLAGGPYGDKCGVSMCLLEISGCSQCPGTRNVAVCSVRHRHVLSWFIQTQTQMVLPAPSSLAVIQSKHTRMWRRCSPRYWKEILPANRRTGEVKVNGGGLHWKGLGYGRRKSGSSDSSRSPPCNRAHARATPLGRSVTRAAARAGLLQPGALGTSATLVSASQGCGSCSGSSPMPSAEPIGSQACIGMGMPLRSMGSALPCVALCTQEIC